MSTSSLCRLGALLACLFSSLTQAGQPALRFAVTESTAMPMMQIEHGEAVGGILYDLQARLAQKVGREARMLVRPRLRVQSMMMHGEIDVRCNVSPAWLISGHHQYIWSLPFMFQRDVLVTRADVQHREPKTGERIGTVLGFGYAALEGRFLSGDLLREDVRTQAQVLEKLAARRYDFAVANQLTLDWFNRHLAPDKRLVRVAEIGRDPLACIVRDEADVPTQALLRAMVQMKEDGELDAILARYR